MLDRTWQDGGVEQTRRRWLLIGVLVAWAAVLVGLAVWSVHAGPETIRPHSDLVSGRQNLDRAVETLRAGAGPDVRVDLEPYEVTEDCRLTVARRGTEVDRTLVLSVAHGSEPAVLEELASRVPADWSARFYPDTGRFRADAGDFIAVTGETPEPGQVRLTVSTGCRPGEDPALDR